MKKLLGYMWRLARAGAPTFAENLIEAYSCATLSSYVYHTDPTTLGPQLREATGRSWTIERLPTGASPWHSFVFRTAGFCYVVFRGTLPIRGEQSDADLTDAVYGWLDNAVGMLDSGQRNTIHSAEAQRVLASLERVAAAAHADQQRIVLTGHSAGGAIAVLAAAFLSQKMVFIDRVLTFGAPMPGTADVVLRTSTPTLRFEHGRDPVPWIPGQYAHVLAPSVGFVAESYGTFTGRWPPQAWQPVGELWFLHPPGSPVRTTTLITSTGHGLSVGETRELIEARANERKARAPGAFKDHAVAAYVDSIGRLVVGSGLAG